MIQAKEMFIFDDIIETSHGGYYLKTVNDEKRNLVIATLFNEGSVIHKDYFPYDNLQKSDLFNFIHQKHLNILNELQSLFHLLNNSENLSFENQFLLAEVCIKKGLYKDVLPFLNKLLQQKESQNKKDQIYFYLAYIYDKIGNLEKSASYYKNIVQMKPNYPDYQNYYGEILLKLEHTLEAIKSFQKAIELNNYYSIAHYNLGLGYLQNYIFRVQYSFSKDFPNSCIHEFDLACELYPLFKNDNFLYGKEYFHKEEWNKAYSYFLRAREETEVNYNNEFILNFRFKLLNNDKLTIEDMREYIEKLENIVNRYPNYPDLFNELGVAYILFSNLLSKAGIQHFKHALELNNNYQKAKKNLKLMENESLGHEIILEAITR